MLWFVLLAHGNNLQAISEGKLWKMDRQTFRKIVLKSAFQVRKKSFHMWNHLYTYLFFRRGRCTNHSCPVFRFLNTWMWVRVHSYSWGTVHEWKVSQVYGCSCQRLNLSTYLIGSWFPGFQIYLLAWSLQNLLISLCKDVLIWRRRTTARTSRTPWWASPILKGRRLWGKATRPMECTLSRY